MKLSLLTKLFQIISILFIFLCLFSDIAVCSEKITSSPKIKFSKTTHDFGTIKRGEKVSVLFRYENIGNSPLIIKDIHSPCGCTAVESEARALLPGEAAFIRVTFDSALKRGPQKQPITIVTNETVDNITKLIVLANVLAEVELLPEEIVAKGIMPGEEIEYKVSLINNGKRSFNILKIESSRSEIHLKADKKHISAKSENKFSVRIKVPSDSKKTFSGRVLLKTDHPDYKVFELKIRLTLKGAKKRLPKVHNRLFKRIKKK